MIAGMILNLCVLSGCSMDAQEDGKLRDLDFTVVSQEEQPDALRDVIEEKKTKPFQISYTRGEDLFPARSVLYCLLPVLP